MAFDACGTTKLEGEEMIKRLAVYLDVNPEDLKDELIQAVDRRTAFRLAREDDSE